MKINDRRNQYFVLTQVCSQTGAVRAESPAILAEPELQKFIDSLGQEFKSLEFVVGKTKTVLRKGI